jgi:hypothetical protein
MSSRKSRQVEVRLVAEYLKETYPRYPFINKQPLGKVPSELLTEVGYKRAVGMSRPFRPEVDAIVIMPGALVLIEAKVWSVVDGCAKLPLYKSLVPFTPELKQYLKLPITMELVVAKTNDNLEIMAREMGVTVRLFAPDWVLEVIKGMESYWTKEYRVERERKLEARRILGVD